MITEADITALSQAELRQVLSWIMRRIQRPARDGKWIALLRSLAVGESSTVDLGHIRDRYAITRAKHGARQRMNEPDAQWTSRSTNKGLRVTRIR